ncbi:ATP-binding protein [Streptomyces sp. B1866]|uniref:ATP-binding protein n=1 Tax=Streptomyces sp. B1866 TaxID=3075431 RepID=UPI002890578C|nr:ATP-binding protein [Streptomyces sp. B1866]MDT3396885.1 ATP-binding protein [Streptomyces sp. B1866]
MALPPRTTKGRPLSGGRHDGGPRQESFRLPARGASVAAARRRVRSRLPLWGFRDEVCHAAELVMSELFTNAVVHTRSRHIRCLLRAEGGQSLYVEVADQGGGPVGPDPRHAGTEDESGRGLALVRALVDAWGDHPGADGGRVVWAQLGGAA